MFLYIEGGFLLFLFLSILPFLMPVHTADAGRRRDDHKNQQEAIQWDDERYERMKHLCPIDIEPTSLVSSVIKESEFEVRCWLDKAIFLLDEFNGDGWNPLLWATASNQPRILELLLKAGANVDISNEAGDTALAIAVYTGNAAILKILLHYNANPEPKSKISSTSPLAKAAMNGHVSCVQMLLDANANVNSKNSLGRTPLLHATMGGFKNIVSLLIKRGAFVNLQDDNKFTALMIAASKGFEEIAKNLIAKGANLNLQDHEGHTALIWAVIGKHHNISKALLEDCFDDSVVFKRICANHRIRDKDKRSALSYAVMYSDTVIGPILSDLRSMDDEREKSGL